MAGGGRLMHAQGAGRAAELAETSHFQLAVDEKHQMPRHHGSESDMTGGLGIVSAILLFLTDWGGSDEEELDVALAPIAGGGAAFVGGRF